MTSMVDILEGHNGPVNGPCSESSTCDLLLGQREGAGRAHHRITTRLAQTFHHRRVVVIVMLDGSRSSATGPRRADRQILSIVRYTKDRFMWIGVLHTLNSADKVTIPFRIVGFGSSKSSRRCCVHRSTSVEGESQKVAHWSPSGSFY